MKNLLVAASILVTGTIAHAQDARIAILENSVVKSTYSLMQSKHSGSCTSLTVDSVQFMCMGAIPTVKKLELISSGCGISVNIKCPTESARIFGMERSISAIDASGVRRDVEPFDLGTTFSSIEITPNIIK